MSGRSRKPKIRSGNPSGTTFEIRLGINGEGHTDEGAGKDLLSKNAIERWRLLLQIFCQIQDQNLLHQN